MNLRLLRQQSKLPQIRSFQEQQQKPILKTILDSYEWAYSVYTVDSDGYIVARGDNKPILNSDGGKKYFRGDRKYMKEIMAGKAIGQQVLLSRRLDVPAFILCVPINEISRTSRVSALPFGALCMAMKLTSISKAVVDSKIGKTGYAILLDNRNQVIAHGNPNLLVDSLQDLSDFPVVKSSVENSLLVYEQDGSKKVVFAKTTEQKWRLLIERDFNEAYSQLIAAKINFLLILLATVMLSIFVSLSMARNLAKPIQQLTVVANSISHRNLHKKLKDSSRNDEIGEFSRAIERMAFSVILLLKKMKRRS